jgi:hypothetical protein
VSGGGSGGAWWRVVAALVATTVESLKFCSLFLFLFHALLLMLSRHLVPLSSSADVHSGVFGWIAFNCRCTCDDLNVCVVCVVCVSECVGGWVCDCV